MSSYDGWLHEKDAGRVGVAIRVACIPTVSITPLVGLWCILLTAGLFFGSFMGMWLSPDLDHMATTRTEYQAIKRGGPIGWFWVGFWTWYAAIVPHRSFWSHSIVGTAIRVAIFIGIFVHLPIWGAFQLLNFKFDFVATMPLYAGIAIAVAIHDAVHYVRDGLDPLGLVKLWK